mgnify:CR=1 FL=1
MEMGRNALRKRKAKKVGWGEGRMQRKTPSPKSQFSVNLFTGKPINLKNSIERSEMICRGGVWAFLNSTERQRPAYARYRREFLNWKLGLQAEPVYRVCPQNDGVSCSSQTNSPPALVLATRNVGGRASCWCPSNTLWIGHYHSFQPGWRRCRGGGSPPEGPLAFGGGH